MPPDLRKRAIDPSAIESDLKVLATNSKALNRLTDELTKLVEHIESTINALNLGLRAWVPAEISSDEEGRWSHNVRLSYDKIDGNWRLGIEEYDEDVQDPEHWLGYNRWAFKDAPRALRLQVVDKIPDLIKALVEESEKVAAETTVTVARALEIASSLSKSAPTTSGLGNLSKLAGK